MKHVELTNGGCATVSDCDYELVSAYSWHFVRSGRHMYVKAWANGKKVVMHRLILGAKRGQHVDHRNGNGLDNRRENIRTCSPAENAMNRRVQKHSSRYKGVRLHDNGKWVARIKIGGKLRHLGCFEVEDNAALAYNREAKRLFGEFALLNDVNGRAV